MIPNISLCLAESCHSWVEDGNTDQLNKRVGGPGMLAEVAAKVVQTDLTGSPASLACASTLLMLNDGGRKGTLCQQNRCQDLELVGLCLTA